MLENNVGIVEILMEDSNKQNSYITQCNLPLVCLYIFKLEHLQMVQEVQGSLSLHADQADLQYHGIQPDPEDLKAHQDPTET